MTEMRLLELLGQAAGYFRAGKHAEEIAKGKVIGEAKGNIEALELYRQAGFDFIPERMIQRTTVTDVVSSAAPLIKDGAAPESTNADWVRNFFDKCRLTSDEDMKNLWAKVLAGEINAPGTFTKRTVNLVAELEKSDAEFFTKIGSFVLQEREPYLFIINYNLPFFKNAGVSGERLMKLQDAGLLDSESFGGYGIQDPPDELVFRYFDGAIKLTRRIGRRDTFLVPSIFMLTTSGRQLYPICGAEKNPDFLQYLVDHFRGVSVHGWEAEILR